MKLREKHRRRIEHQLLPCLLNVWLGATMDGTVAGAWHYTLHYMEYWNIVILEYTNTVILEYWNTGIL